MKRLLVLLVLVFGLLARSDDSYSQTTAALHVNSIKTTSISGGTGVAAGSLFLSTDNAREHVVLDQLGEFLALGTAGESQLIISKQTLGSPLFLRIDGRMQQAQLIAVTIEGKSGRLLFFPD